jgi:hypothetical protein
MFVDNISIIYQEKAIRINQLITYKQNLATKLQKIDRVHTYMTSFIPHLNY